MTGNASAAAAKSTAWVAVVGNPNSGKSTLFNRLTGARQKVGNYPGITVETKRGTLPLGDHCVTLVDVPGAYSLAAGSEDEQIVVDLLCGRIAGLPRPDAVLCCVDATNLKRNLFFVSQVAELGLPVVVALNMIDLAEKQGMKIDVARLSRQVGVPVVPTAAPSGRGMEELRAAIADVLSRRPSFLPVPWPEAVREASREIGAEVAARTGRTPEEGERNRLLFDADSTLPERLKWTDPDAALSRARGRMREAGMDPLEAESVLRYRHIETLLEGAVTKPDRRAVERSYAFDRLLTHRVFGLLIFFALMLGVFASIYWLAQPLMDGIDAAFAALGGWAAERLASTPALQSLVADGVVAGVGGVVVFLPQILILFFFIGLLEDSGYMARAAFLMDKVFSWTGLNGKSFVPMLSSYACAVPAILGARTIEDPRARLTTILISPLMSCSARLPVYVLLIGVFIEPRFGQLWAGVALFALHLLGLVVAIPVAFLLNRFFLRLRSLPFLLELPPYRLPRLPDVLWRMWLSGREFVMRAGTVIFVFSLVIWAMSYFPRPESVRTEAARAEAERRGIPVAEAERLFEGELAPVLKTAYLEQSFLGRFGKTVQPLFAPAGFDWKITVGVLASFPAREVMVSTLGIVYSLDEGESEGGAESKQFRERMAGAKWPDGRPVYTPWVAMAVMVFFALCLQCGSTVAVIARETGWRWAVFAFSYMTVLAWVGAVAVYQGGKLFG